jgi:nucleoside 2-deoxyribosyltransferase
MKIYLAGPDVFRPDVSVWAKSAREICRRYGFEPLLPIDHGETLPEKIFQANIDLIRKAQVVVANLDPFRGAEPDSGTCFELGYALALGKKVCGYMAHLETLAQRVERQEQRCEPPVRYGGKLTDRNGMVIEDFGLPCNLMLAMAGQIIEGDLEACLQSIRPRTAVPA